MDMAPVVTAGLLLCLVAGSFWITMGRTATRTSVIRAIGSTLLGAISFLVGYGLMWIDVRWHTSFAVMVLGIAMAFLGPTFWWVGVPVHYAWRRHWAPLWRLSVTGALLFACAFDVFGIHALSYSAYWL